MSRHLCLFDLDHTLLPLDSDHTFGSFLVSQGLADPVEFQKGSDYFYSQYLATTLDIHAYIEFTTAPWRHLSAERQRQIQQSYFDEIIRPHIKPAALDLVRQHQKRGDLIAIVTATNEFVTRPIANAFDISDLIAVELERDENGHATGKIDGTPSYQGGKIARVQQWLKAQGLGLEHFESSTFYSDSINDLPLLEQVTHPVATNPSPALEEIAHQKGWRILNLFNDQEIHS